MAITASADAYVARMQADIQVFLDWLTANNAKGDFGEFGWPQIDDAYAYARFAEALYETIEGYDVWLAQWLCSENVPNHVLSAYRGSNTHVGEAATAMNTRTFAGRIVEQHLQEGRGINIGNSGENMMYGAQTLGDTQAFSNAREISGVTFGTGGTIAAADSPDTYQNGAYVKQWNYGSQATWDFLGSRRVRHVRLPFRAERIYRTFGGSLDATEVARIQTVLGYAADNDINVVLDCHNFGYYYLDNGSAGVAKALGGATWTDAYFADMWAKLVAAFDGYSAVIGYDIMNEPVGAAGTWVASTSQAAVTAIRGAGSTKTVVVEFKSYCHPEDVNATSATPWITDALDNIRYSVHCYFDYATLKASSYNLPGGAENSIYYANLKNCKDAGYTGTDVYPTVSTAGVVDSFDRPDTLARATLGSTEDPSFAHWINSTADGSGSDYDFDGGFDWYILNNVATNFNGNQVAVFVKTGVADGFVQVTLPHVGTSGGIWFRGAQDGSSGLAVDVGGIYKVVRSTSGNPTYTTLTSWSSPGYASGDTITVSMTGTAITATRTRSGVDTVLGSATSSYNQTATCHGLWCFGTSTPRTTWSDFSVYDSNALPVAGFTLDDGTAYPVQFTSTSTDSDGTIVSYDWDFGDGSTSTEQNPLHTYTDVGDYTVVLTVTDSGGGQSLIEQTVSVFVSGAVSLEGLPDIGAAPILAGAFVGQTLTSATGEWDGGTAPTGYTYQWQVSDDGATGWANIAAETATTYVVDADTLGKYVRCLVTATNTSGTGGAAPSAPLGPIDIGEDVINVSGSVGHYINLRIHVVEPLPSTRQKPFVPTSSPPRPF